MVRSKRSPPTDPMHPDPDSLSDKPAQRRLVRQLAAAVQALLPPLGVMVRTTNHPSSETHWVRWAPPGAVEDAALVVSLTPDDVVVTAGFSARGREETGRRPRLGDLARRKRDLADVLPTLLAALRAAGATLHAHRESVEALSELDWIAAVAAGAVRFRASDDPAVADERGRVAVSGASHVMLARWASERCARLLDFWALLLGWKLPPAPTPPSRGPVAAIRSLRWDERAAGADAPPTALLPSSDAWCYDPTTGWFAPQRFTALSPATVANARWCERHPHAEGSTVGLRRSADPGLRARLLPWLRARHLDADGAMVHRANLLVPTGFRDADAPVLPALVSQALGDPSGDVAVALVGLLLGAPWPGSPQAASVAARVRPRWSLQAATGASRLLDAGLLGPSWEASHDCLTDAAVRPLLWLAAQRALGDLQCAPEGSSGPAEALLARPWEIVPAMQRPATLEALARRFERSLRAEGLRFELDLLRAVLVGLRTRPFAVFAGVSGTGKTRLALRLAQFVTGALPGGHAPRVAVVSVRPDWIDSRGLLGYVNVLRDPPHYEPTPALRVLLRAAAHPDEPHFLILDEMNLARPEHYLAELLSAVESGAPVDLHGRVDPVLSADRSVAVPSSVPIGRNVAVIATINVDETTHPLSPKVLDRAWLWEFPAAAPSALLAAWVDPSPAEEPAAPAERLALLSAVDDDDPARAMLLAMGRDGVGATLDRLHAVMSAHGRPFGFRVASEVLRFVDRCDRDQLPVPPGWPLDHALLGKVLPRWSGARRELHALLKDAREALTNEGAPAQPPSSRSVREAPTRRAPPSLPRCLGKLDALVERCAREDYVTFTR